MLIVSPQGTNGGWVDLGYLQDLHQAGFEVDYTDSMSDVTWERLRRYNVLLLYSCPPEPGHQAWPFRGAQPIYKAEFIALITRFLEQGGGVLLMAVETQISVTLVRDMIRPWGADLPLETIVDPENTAVMTRMPKVPLAYTNQITASPVSEGVRAIWYPTLPHYNGADSIPLAVDGGWQVVVRGMPSARTQPVDLAKSSRPGPPDPLVRRDGVSAPPLFAIREYGGGRIALLSQWPIYSVGSGTKWLYDREVLSKGLEGRPSDFGRLLENSFRWLAAPSLRTRALGGHVTAAERLQAPNLRPTARDAFKEPVATADSHAAQASKDQPLFKGLIGARTALTGGQGTVADYVAEAKRAGLDFLVFLEDFASLDESTLARLKADCQRHSDANLTVLPGYRITTNIGNQMFLFGRGVSRPPSRLLTGKDGSVFMLQGEIAPGVFGTTPPSAMEFLFTQTVDTQIGYYDFSHSGTGMRLRDVRLYAMLGVRTYRDGRLADDAIEDYLTSTQATIAGAAAAVHLVDSPAALRTAAQARQGLTYATARSRTRLWEDALRYTNQYTCPNVFTSTGPMIQAWPECTRVSTFGAEPFVTGRSLATARMHVTSDKGLAEVRVYDGHALFRRFRLSGDQDFQTVLQLDASVQRNLVVVAEDIGGGVAVSSPRRSWKDGSLAPVFCSDRINDCAYMFLARGPYPMTVLRTPEIPDAGFTWDGGPRGILTPIDFEGSSPRAASDAGLLNGDQYTQTPLLELADEGAVSVRSVRDEMIDPRVRAVNPWTTYGPRVAARNMDFWLSYTQFDRPNVSVPPVGYAGFPSQSGCTAALFRGQITFSQAVDVSNLQLLRNWNWIDALDLHLVVGRRRRVMRDIALPDMRPQSGQPNRELYRFRIGRGDWFGFYSPTTANSQLFVNRGRPLELRVDQRQGGDWLSVGAAGSPDLRTTPYRYELFGIGCPLDAAVHAAQGFADHSSYLSHPDGLEVSRGRRSSAPGPIELYAQQFAVHISVDRPSTPTHLTLPLVVNGLNRRWTSGLWQISGFVKGDYGPGSNRYRELGIDSEDRSYVPLYPDLAERSEVEIGHPIIADARGRELFIQVTALSGGTERNPGYAWTVTVNNPTDRAITTVLTRNMDLPNLHFERQELMLAPGENRTVYTTVGMVPAT